MAADRELNHSDRRRSLKRRYLHLQVAGRSHVLSGSGGTSADSRRKAVSDRAASQASSAAMTSAPRYFILGFPSIMTIVLHPWRTQGRAFTLLQPTKTLLQVGLHMRPSSVANAGLTTAALNDGILLDS